MGFRTEMLFPVGVGNRRYFLQTVWHWDNSPVTLGLAYEVKEGERINKVWWLPLEFDPKRGSYLPQTVAEMGTLRQILYRNGLRPKGRVSAAIRDALDAKTSFATYKPNEPIIGGFFYGFVRWGSSGNWPPVSEHANRKLPGVYFTYKDGPFRITDEERMEMARQELH